MSSVNRRRAALTFLSAVIGAVVLAGGGVTAQSGDPGEPASLDTTGRCGPQAADATGRGRVAALPGALAAVGVPLDTPECVLPVQRVDQDEPASLVRLLDRLGVERLDVLADGGEDLLTLDGSPVPATLDDALAIEEIRFGSGVITRDSVDDIVRMFERSRLDDLHPVLGGAPEQILERGQYMAVAFDTLGDPTAPSNAVRTWELGFAGKDPVRNVPSVGGAGNPYSGLQHVLTYAQVPTEDGGFEGRLGHTNFGSDRLGPDGQSQFYNGRTDFLVLAHDDGVVFIVPAELAPVGFRGWTRGGDPVVWDIVQGPGGPTALVPPDGSWAGVIDTFLASVVHEPITLPATVNGEPMPTGDFPSHLNLVLGVPLVDPDQPLTIDLSYLTSGTTVGFDDLEAQPVGDGLFGVQVGLTQYGPHAFDGLRIEQLGELPEGWDLLSEEARMFGWAPFVVDEQEGAIHGHFVQPWLLGEDAAARHAHDTEVAAALLEEAGWLAAP